MVRIVIFAAMCAVGMSHLCMLSPYQRNGPVNDTELSKAGSDFCGLITDPPCGGVKSGRNTNAAIMSERMPIVMQKNLDHFNEKAPGNFTVNLWSEEGKFLRTIATVMDDSRPSGSVYQAEFLVPHDGGHDHNRFILQTIYYPNHDPSPAAFYQCADLEVYPRND